MKKVSTGKNFVMKSYIFSRWIIFCTASLAADLNIYMYIYICMHVHIYVFKHQTILQANNDIQVLWFLCKAVSIDTWQKFSMYFYITAFFK